MIAKELISELEKIHERYIPENNQRLNSANTRLGLLAFPADVSGEGNLDMAVDMFLKLDGLRASQKIKCIPRRSTFLLGHGGCLIAELHTLGAALEQAKSTCRT
jgi:hypothetical protein